MILVWQKLATLLPFTTGKELLKAFLCLNAIKWSIKCDKRAFSCMQMIRFRIRPTQLPFMNIFKWWFSTSRVLDSHDRISFNFDEFAIICANFQNIFISFVAMAFRTNPSENTKINQMTCYRHVHQHQKVLQPAVMKKSFRSRSKINCLKCKFCSKIWKKRKVYIFIIVTGWQRPKKWGKCCQA